MIPDEIVSSIGAMFKSGVVERILIKRQRLIEVFFGLRLDFQMKDWYTRFCNSLGRSQVGKARDFDSRIRWFESSRPSQIYD